MAHVDFSREQKGPNIIRYSATRSPSYDQIFVYSLMISPFLAFFYQGLHITTVSGSLAALAIVVVSIRLLAPVEESFEVDRTTGIQVESVTRLGTREVKSATLDKIRDVFVQDGEKIRSRGSYLAIPVRSHEVILVPFQHLLPEERDLNAVAREVRLFLGMTPESGNVDDYKRLIRRKIQGLTPAGLPR
mmetsp:Transcript_33011/g.53552  ORF Transcript_33011/g.53552 Transcript_33011/m.53552 type:complete len:189 (+) Transcript_33011:32-598(+)